jgi:hypothetical protein
MQKVKILKSKLFTKFHITKYIYFMKKIIKNIDLSKDNLLRHLKINNKSKMESIFCEDA